MLHSSLGSGPLSSRAKRLRAVYWDTIGENEIRGALHRCFPASVNCPGQSAGAFFPRASLGRVWSAPHLVDTGQAARLTIRRACSCSNLAGLRYPSAEWSRLLPLVAISGHSSATVRSIVSLCRSAAPGGKPRLG